MSENKPIHMAYPLAGFAGTLLLCAYLLHGGHFLELTAEVQAESTSVEDAD